MMKNKWISSSLLETAIAAAVLVISLDLFIQALHHLVMHALRYVLRRSTLDTFGWAQVCLKLLPYRLALFQNVDSMCEELLLLCVCPIFLFLLWLVFSCTTLLCLSLLGTLEHNWYHFTLAPGNSPIIDFDPCSFLGDGCELIFFPKLIAAMRIERLDARLVKV